MRRRTTLALLPLALVLAACGSGDGADTTTTTTTADETTTTTTATTTTAAPSGASVSIAGFSFGPGELTVEAGTEVTWTNDDTVPHTVTADDGSFDAGTLQPGESFTHTFESEATVAYHCSIHPSMTATIEVTGGG